MKKFLLFILLFSGLLLHAQSKFHVEPKLGIVLPALSEGFGISPGVNFSYNFSKHFALESQLNYSHVKITSAFVSGKESRENSFNLLIGPRLYLYKPERKNNFYLNFLAGLNYLTNSKQEYIDSESKYSNMDGGISAGIYYLYDRKFSTGIAVESPGYLLVKFGYIL